MNEVVINFLNKVSYTSYFANPLHPLTPPSLLSLLLTPPFPTPPSFQVPYHSDKFSQEAWLVQQLKERERVVRGKENDVLPMQTCGASEQVGTVHLMNVSYSIYHFPMCTAGVCRESEGFMACMGGGGEVQGSTVSRSPGGDTQTGPRHVGLCLPGRSTGII